MYHERFGFTSYKHYLCIVKPNIQKIMAVFIKLRQSRFKEENGGGKWFAQTVSRGEVHTDDIAKAIEENSTFKRGEVKGLIDELVETMTHELQMGKTVVLDGFGRSLESPRTQTCTLMANLGSSFFSFFDNYFLIIITKLLSLQKIT